MVDIKKFLVLFVILLITPLVLAETLGSVSGKVFFTTVDGTILTPASGVTIDLANKDESSTYSTSTSGDGSYSFIDIVQQSYKITASFTGLDSLSQTITFSTPNLVDIDLNLECIDSDEDGLYSNICGGTDSDDNDPSIGIQVITNPPSNPSGGGHSCTQDWECTEWSKCESTGEVIQDGVAEKGMMTRTCEDKERCHMQDEKPETEKTCVYYLSNGEQPITEENTEVQTLEEQPLGITGAVVKDIKETGGWYWLLGLGIVILITGGILYYNKA